MKVKLMTDAPNHNLALMKISSYHKAMGDDVFLGKPQDPCDKSYASWLFGNDYQADFIGGTFYPGIKLPEDIECQKPDYSLFNLDHSVGYTWSYCPRSCGFCIVPKQDNLKKHQSIWDFHDSKYDKICLLNNNTFSDPRYRETFEEIWDANLTVIDENGYDLRLLDYEKLYCLNRTKFVGTLHFAWDFLTDENRIKNGLELIKGLRHEKQIYVLIGYPDKWVCENDIYRCQVIADAGYDPFIMVYNRIKNSKEPRMRQLNQFERMVNRTFLWRKHGFQKAWLNYK